MEESVFRSRRYWAVLAALAVGLCVLFVGRHRERAVYHTDDGVVWTTGYHIVYSSPSPLADSIQAVLARVDASASVYNEQSLVSRINRNDTSQPDSLFTRLYNCSWTIYWLSGGSYDPTVMPLVEAWGFGHDLRAEPTQAQLDSILPYVGMKRTRLAGGVLTKDDPRTQFDFSSIAKGFAVDEVGRMLERNGVKNYLVEIGGEVLARGVNQQGAPWHVSVDLPLSQADSVVHSSAVVLTIDSLAVATSGNYRKFRDRPAGERVSHIIDPLTGRGQVSNLLSVTIVAPDCMTADAWATACMAMGLERTRAMMERVDNLGVMTISTDDDGNWVVWSNHRFASLAVQ